MPLRDQRRNCDQTRVHHSSQVVGVLAAALSRRVEHRLQQVLLIIGQVTWVRHAPYGDRSLGPCNRDTPTETVGTRQQCRGVRITGHPGYSSWWTSYEVAVIATRTYDVLAQRSQAGRYVAM